MHILDLVAGVVPALLFLSLLLALFLLPVIRKHLYPVAPGRDPTVQSELLVVQGRPISDWLASVDRAVSLPPGVVTAPDDVVTLAARIRYLVEQMATIVARVRDDELGCVPPTGRELPNVAAEVVLDEHDPFTGGPAVLSSERATTVRNEILRALRKSRADVLRLIGSISVHLSTAPTKGAWRVDVAARSALIARVTLPIDEFMIRMQQQLQIECANQRQRFAASGSSMSSYTFDTWSIHDRDTLPRYEYGDASMAVPRVSLPSTAHVDAAQPPTSVPSSTEVGLCNGRWCENPAQDAMREVTG